MGDEEAKAPESDVFDSLTETQVERSVGLVAISTGALVLLVLAVPAFFILRWILEPFGPAYIVQSRGAVSLADARKSSSLPLPDSARNIRFARFQQWIAYETFVRFEAPVSDCVAFAEAVHQAHNQHRVANDIRPAIRLVDIQELVDPSVALSAHLETGWFDVQNIRKGKTSSSRNASHQPQVWIDTERGVCYYKYTD